jgi:hypothetical protein
VNISHGIIVHADISANELEVSKLFNGETSPGGNSLYNLHGDIAQDKVCFQLVVLLMSYTIFLQYIVLYIYNNSDITRSDWLAAVFT